MKKKVVKEYGTYKVLVWDKDKVIGGGQAETEKDAYEMATYNYRAARRMAYPPLSFRKMVIFTSLGVVLICIAVLYVLVKG